MTTITDDRLECPLCHREHSIRKSTGNKDYLRCSEWNVTVWLTTSDAGVDYMKKHIRKAGSVGISSIPAAEKHEKKEAEKSKVVEKPQEKGKPKKRVFGTVWG